MKKRVNKKRHHYRGVLMIVAILGLLNIGAAYAEDANVENAPVVLELFTSQGCSSCPPADALLKRLSAENARLLPLSFHVDYWNYLGWKDPYSSPANTERQRGYASARDGKVYTPELVVNGGAGVIGSNERQVRAAIDAAQRKSNPVQVQIAKGPDGSTFNVTVSGENQNIAVDVWAVGYQPHSQNHVMRGENSGRTLDHVNSVTGLKRLGTWQGSTASYTLNLPENKGDKIAILIQMPNYGHIIGAAVVP